MRHISRRAAPRLAGTAAAGVLGALLLAGCAAPAPDPATSGPATDPATNEPIAESCGTITLAGLDDDSSRLAFYALENDLVASDAIDDVMVSFLQIPALIQASQSGQFDYLMISLQGVVQARANGLDLRVIAFSTGYTGAGFALYTRADSPVTSGGDLAGLTIATPSFGATSTVEAQYVLADKYGIDAALEGGDVTWTELDPPTALNALAKGDIDAALLWNQAGWLASQNPELKNVEQLDVSYHDLTGSWPIGAVFVGDGEKIDASPECAAEFQRLLGESVAYAEEHAAELAPEISEASGVPAEYIEFWWNPDHYQYGGVVDETWKGYAETFYELAVKHGTLAEVPPLSEFVFEG